MYHLHRWNRSNPDVEIKISGCYVNNAVKTAPIWRKMSTFAKISAHIERRFKINAYLCNVAEGPLKSKHRKRLAFSMLMNLDTHLEKWKGKDVLPLVMIV